MSARGTPDGEMFQRTTDLRHFQRDFPNGLEVCAAPGSSFARSRLAAEERGKLLAEIDRNKSFVERRNLYCEYLRCLESLSATPEPEAPPFMSTEPWQIKSCQTVLGGWAQLRHTWALQAKQNMSYGCGSEVPPGFVEPVPEFYARLATLVETTEAVLKEAGAFTNDPRELAADIRAGAVLNQEDWKIWRATKKPMDYSVLSPQQLTQIEIAEEMESVLLLIDDKKFDSSSDEGFARITAEMNSLADGLEQGRLPDNPRMAALIRDWDRDMGELWHSLAMLCRRLESLAHKQLRGIAFSDEENRFIESYGARLAKVMFYNGNSYVIPRDDAPRAIDVFSNPNVHKCLEVGIGRPRAIYVLYPVKGGEILCLGAIMPYYEFPNDKPLTDADWKAPLDSNNRPNTPDWINPIIVSGAASHSKPKSE